MCGDPLLLAQATVKIRFSQLSTLRLSMTWITCVYHLYGSACVRFVCAFRRLDLRTTPLCTSLVATLSPWERLAS